VSQKEDKEMLTSKSKGKSKSNAYKGRERRNSNRGMSDTIEREVQESSQQQTQGFIAPLLATPTPPLLNADTNGMLEREMKRHSSFPFQVKIHFQILIQKNWKDIWFLTKN
jgi:hypothetical protein